MVLSSLDGEAAVNDHVGEVTLLVDANGIHTHGRGVSRAGWVNDERWGAGDSYLRHVGRSFMTM